jgi:hypothetical protein
MHQAFLPDPASTMYTPPAHSLVDYSDYCSCYYSTAVALLPRCAQPLLLLSYPTTACTHAAAATTATAITVTAAVALWLEDIMVAACLHPQLRKVLYRSWCLTPLRTRPANQHMHSHARHMFKSEPLNNCAYAMRATTQCCAYKCSCIHLYELDTINLLSKCAAQHILQTRAQQFEPIVTTMYSIIQ